jgi:hypothetical protein
MKLALWRKLAAAYLLPDLAPGCHLDGWIVHTEPREWFAGLLVTSLSADQSRFAVNAVAQFLPVPRDRIVANDSLHAQAGPTYFASPSTMHDGAAVMADVATYLRTLALPFLSRQTTLDGRLAHLGARMTAMPDGGWQDTGVDEERCYTQLLRGHRTAAERAAADTARAAAHDPLPRDLEALDRVRRVMAAGGTPDAQAVLRGYAAHTRAALKVPA